MEEPVKLGHGQIDAQHADLYHCIRQLRAMARKHFSPERVADLLRQMEGMLANHFATEELVMFDVGLEASLLAEHVGEHRRILAEVAEIRRSHRAENAESLPEVCETARLWVVNHVRDYDALLIPRLRNKDVPVG